MAKKKSPFGLRPELFPDTGVVVMRLVRIDNDEEVDKRVYEARKIADKEVRERLFLHGLSTLLQQRASQEEASGKLAYMDRVFARLVEGEWALERAERGPAVVSVEVEALARLRKLTIPQAQAALAQYNKEEREKILASDKLKPLVAKIKEEREAAAAVSLDDLV